MEKDPQTEDDFSEIAPISRKGASAESSEATRTPASVRNIGFGLAFVVLLVVGLVSFKFLPGLVEPVVLEEVSIDGVEDAGAKPVAEPVILVEVIEEKDHPQRDAALKARAVYDNKLRAWQEVQAEGWSPSAYTSAVHTAGEAGESLDARDFELAEKQFLKAVEQLGEIESEIPDVVSGLIQKGRVAVEAGDQDVAVDAFELVLLIESENKVAQAGLIRAKVAADVWAMLERARGHEQSGEWALAQTDYALAVQKDPASNAARSGMNRVRTKLAEAAFQERISEGLTLFNQGKFDEAVRVLEGALEFKPSSPEGKEALALAEAKVREIRLNAIEQQALALEKASQWSDALKLYGEAMNIDRDVVFAREGTKRAKQHLEMTDKVVQLVAQPNKLLEPKGYQYASSLVVEFKTWDVQGSRLAKKISQLELQMKAATTPVQVVLKSDNQTKVDVYKVGRFGVFFVKELALKPGRYTVVGSRTGYRDERQVVLIKPGEEPEPIVVVCAEKI